MITAAFADRIRTELEIFLQGLGVSKLSEPIAKTEEKPDDTLYMVLNLEGYPDDTSAFDASWEPAKQCWLRDIQENGLPHYYRIDVLPFMANGEPALYIGIQPSDEPSVEHIKAKLENIDW